MGGMENTAPAADSVAAHATEAELVPLEKPYTYEEALLATAIDGFLVATVEIPLGDLFAARDREDDGEEGMIARKIVENCPAPFQMGYECVGARNGNPLIVARFDVQDAFFDSHDDEDFDGDIEDEELDEIRSSGLV